MERAKQSLITTYGIMKTDCTFTLILRESHFADEIQYPLRYQKHFLHLAN